MILLLNTASNHKGGSVQVASSFIKECKNYPKNTYHIILGLSLKDKIKKENYPDNFFFYEIS